MTEPEARLNPLVRILDAAKDEEPSEREVLGRIVHETGFCAMNKRNDPPWALAKMVHREQDCLIGEAVAKKVREIDAARKALDDAKKSADDFALNCKVTQKDMERRMTL